MTSEGKQSYISSYNKGHKLFIIPKLHTQQNILKTNLTFNSIYGVVYVDGYILVIRKMKIETKTFHDMRNSLLCPFV